MPCIPIKGGFLCVPRIVEHHYGGRTWRWEMHSFFGPTPIKADNSPWKKFPSDKHSFWNAFENWCAKHNAASEPATESP